MATLGPSQDMCRGRRRQPQVMGSPHFRTRSESRHLLGRGRTSMTHAQEQDHSSGALQLGDPVEVYSRTDEVWTDGEVVGFEGDDHVCVEYSIKPC